MLNVVRELQVCGSKHQAATPCVNGAMHRPHAHSVRPAYQSIDLVHFRPLLAVSVGGGHDGGAHRFGAVFGSGPGLEPILKKMAMELDSKPVKFALVRTGCSPGS